MLRLKRCLEMSAFRGFIKWLKSTYSVDEVTWKANRMMPIERKVEKVQHNITDIWISQRRVINKMTGCNYFGNRCFIIVFKIGICGNSKAFLRHKKNAIHNISKTHKFLVWISRFNWKIKMKNVRNLWISCVLKDICCNVQIWKNNFI